MRVRTFSGSMNYYSTFIFLVFFGIVLKVHAGHDKAMYVKLSDDPVFHNSYGACDDQILNDNFDNMWNDAIAMATAAVQAIDQVQGTKMNWLPTSKNLRIARALKTMFGIEVGGFRSMSTTAAQNMAFVRGKSSRLILSFVSHYFILTTLTLISHVPKYDRLFFRR
ncbi:hypothetical protein N7510_001379 [Penicillium lagena]|uniref:uncharacterized protein n=1 Tax=Penicillium lagena TaxID=94218 RepID=UPI002541A79F|nr:uncharacterized protein N7510_001379 [Penicillium lagena]KAJ5625070.1 hypothetical protein N7510_001379 [Penicillium lagena]